MPAGESFRFICDPAHVKNMHKVISHHQGEVVAQQTAEEGVYFTVARKKR
jgi:hypothetical protein